MEYPAIITILMGIVGILAGFGLSQLIGMQNVKADRVRIAALEVHVGHLVDLMTKQVEQDIILISELKAART